MHAAAPAAVKEQWHTGWVATDGAECGWRPRNRRRRRRTFSHCCCSCVVTRRTSVPLDSDWTVGQHFVRWTTESYQRLRQQWMVVHVQLRHCCYSTYVSGDNNNNKLCARPPQYVPAPCKLTFDLLTLKVVSESRLTWATSVPILVFIGLSVLDLGPMYATDRHQTGRRQTRIIAWCLRPIGAEASSNVDRRKSIYIRPLERQSYSG